jgi:hypothetical protein
MYGWSAPHGAFSDFSSGSRSSMSSETAITFTSIRPVVPPGPPLQVPDGTQPSMWSCCGPIVGVNVERSTPSPRKGATSR